jgi:cytoskeletal protein CcmA (bactofilin family)
MFASKRQGTVIAEGLKIVGSVTAEGLVEVNGQIEGELHCTSLVISPKAQIAGAVTAERIVVNGRVEGPIQGGDVVLKAKAHVVGDIQHHSLSIERGAFFDGRSLHEGQAAERAPARGNGAAERHAERNGMRPPRDSANKDGDGRPAA